MIDEKFRDDQKTIAALAFFWAKVQSDPSEESPLLSLLADDRAIEALVEIDLANEGLGLGRRDR